MSPARVVKKGTRKHAPPAASGPCFPPAAEKADALAGELRRLREVEAAAKRVAKAWRAQPDQPALSAGAAVALAELIGLVEAKS